MNSFSLRLLYRCPVDEGTVLV